ncbi:MAG TPA: hypothetical protein VMT62_03720 [Syntrophorhabdaceae bacterium]|nr:hypothetical protein [Syntrophorhabdaceae bacterium]
MLKAYRLNDYEAWDDESLQEAIAIEEKVENALRERGTAVSEVGWNLKVLRGGGHFLSIPKRDARI